MAENLKIFLELVARASGFKSELNSSKSAVSRFAAGARQELATLKGAFSSIGGQLAALGVSVGTVKTIMDSARLDKSLTQIGQTAGEGSGKVMALRSDLFRLGKDSGGNIEGLRDGFNSLVQSGLDMREAKETLDGINVAMAVTGASSQTLAGGLTVAAEAFQFDLAKPGQALEMLDRMTVAGRLGNAELEDLSSIFARVGVNASSAGMGFDKTLGFIEGLSKVEKQPERLATLADSTLRVFTNMRYMAEAQKATGIKFFDDKGARRDALDVLDDIKTQYDTLTTDQSRASFIQKAFGHADLDTIKGIRTLLQGDSLNKVRTFSEYINVAGGTLKRDFGEATNNLVDQAGRVRNVLREAADGFAGPIKDTLRDMIKWGLDTKKNGGLELDGKDMIYGGAGGLLGTVLLARYGSMGLGALAGKFLKGGSSLGLGVAQGKAIEAATGVTPVFVTNWPGTFGPNSPGGLASSSIPAASTAVSTAAVAATVVAVPAVAAGAAKLSMEIGKTITDKQIAASSSESLRDIRSRHMVMGGGPDSYQVRAIDAVLAERNVKNDIQLNIAIDDRGRVTTKSNDMNTRATVSPLKRGDFGQWQTASAH